MFFGCGNESYNFFEKGEKMSDNQKVLSTHWADLSAFRLIKKEDKELYTVAAGISPSGKVHIGNFRELITADLVSRSLKKMGKKVRFIFSWDDFDVFRKIPAGFPEKIGQKKAEEYLRMPLCDVPDHQGLYDSYAAANEKPLEEVAKKVGVCPEHIYQHQKYRKGTYVQGILQALRTRSILRSILDRFRQKALDESWLPISVYCQQCGYDDTKAFDFDEKENISYSCNLCSHQETLNITQASCVKLPWRIDWPMRWSYEKVDFEPGGKDHSSQGGSFDTAKEIVKQVYSFRAPEFLHYDFVKIRGKGGKISSSSGEVITVGDLLKVYEPEIIRHFFVAMRPNVELSIDLGEEVIKNYDVYDRLEMQYFGEKPIKAGKEVWTKRVYELSQVDEPPVRLPFQPGFRHLTNVVQIYSFDEEKIVRYYREKGCLRDDFDEKKLLLRAEKAKNWIEKYAEESFCFSVRQKSCDFSQFSDDYKRSLAELKTLVLAEKKRGTEEKLVFDQIYELIRKNDLNNALFFQYVYQCCIGKDKGPRIASFLLTLEDEVLQNLLP